VSTRVISGEQFENKFDASYQPRGFCHLHELEKKWGEVRCSVLPGYAWITAFDDKVRTLHEVDQAKSNSQVRFSFFIVLY